MERYIKRNTISGVYLHFCPVTGRLLSLKLDYHPAVPNEHCI